MLYYTLYRPRGRFGFDVKIVADEEKLISLCLSGQTCFNGYENAVLINSYDAQPIIRITVKYLNDYFSGKAPQTLPPLATDGLSRFALLIREELLKIAYGKLTTYGAIAEKIAKKTGAKPCAQAVGQAVGKNPISLIVPCHRVIGSGGAITGYNGGTDKKIALLASESIKTDGKRVIDYEQYLY